MLSFIEDSLFYNDNIMDRTLFYISKFNNNYLYDYKHRMSMFVHPSLRKVHDHVSDVDEYYKEKYAYLKQHGFFSKNKPEFVTDLSPDIINSNIIQAKQIIFEVTDSCNLQCTYCILGSYYEGFKGSHSKNIDEDAAFCLLEYIINSKIQYGLTELVISFYGGEPLLNMGFIKEVVRRARNLNLEQKINISYSLTTNATLLHEHIPFFVDNDFKLMISLDGNKKNDSYRIFHINGKESFPKVIENIDYIQKTYPDFFKNNISFNAVLNDRNSVKEIYEFIYCRYQKIPNISELSIDNINPANKHSFDSIFNSKRRSEDKFENDSSFLQSITYTQTIKYSELINYTRYYSVNSYISDIYLLFYDEVTHFPTNTCTPFLKKIYITTQNKILPCEKISHKFALGSIENNKIKLDSVSIANLYNAIYKRMSKQCQHCYANRFCGVCFFDIKNIDFSEMANYSCNAFYNRERMENKLCEIFSYAEANPQYPYEIIQNVTITV